MARSKTTPVRSTLRSVLGRRRIKAVAKQYSVVRRRRKIDVFLLVWTLVLGFQVGTERTLTGLRQAYQRGAGHSLAPSAFYARLNGRMAKLLFRLVQDTLAAQPDGARMPEGVLSGFKELLAIDSSVLRLHDLLSPVFAACRTNHTKAAAKLHVVMNVLDGSARKVQLTSERTSDGTPWRRVGKWVRGRLILFDLGYYNFSLFDRIEANRGFFLSRAKSNFNPLIVAVHRTWRGRAVEVVGRRLRDILPLLLRCMPGGHSGCIWDDTEPPGLTRQDQGLAWPVSVISPASASGYPSGCPSPRDPSRHPPDLRGFGLL
jgi:hypothetical protein